MRVFRSEGRRRYIWRLENLAGLTLVLLLLLSGCGGALVTPRELTGTAQAAAPADPTQTPERLTIETPTPIPAEAIAGGAEPDPAGAAGAGQGPGIEALAGVFAAQAVALADRAVGWVGQQSTELGSRQLFAPSV